MPEPVDYLYRVPTEVWIACWALCSSRQLRRISLVCKLFRSISLPSLFQHQTLDVANVMHRATAYAWVDHFHHLHRMAVRLESLAASPFHALVRSWEVSLPSPEDRLRLQWRSNIKQFFDEILDRATCAFFTTLGLYRNVTSLHITIFLVDGALWETLRCLPMLDTLRVHARSFDVGDRTLAASGDQHSKGALQATSPWRLRNLHLSEDRHLLEGFSPHDLRHLVQLSVQIVEDMASFVQFLGQCPHLVSITVESPSRPRSWRLRSINVPPSSLSLLHTLAGPSWLIRSLVPSRSIRSVRVVERRPSLDDLLSLCTDISRSTHSVAALTLPPFIPTIQFMRNLVALFPDAWELCLAIANKPPIFCYRRRSAARPECAVDERAPVFCDATAFEGLPAEQLSDDEAEDIQPSVDIVAEEFRPSLKASRRHHIEYIIMWICDGLLDLPPNIGSFRLEPKPPMQLMLEQQHSALAALSRRYPSLREIQIGQYDTIWRREGSEEVWKAEGQSAVRITRPTPHECALISPEN